MFLIGRKHSLLNSVFFEGLKDHHCHILPGVDDGIQDIDSSLEALAYYKELGINRVVLTPHVMNGVNPTADAILAAYDLLTSRYNGSIELSLASEYMLDSGFEKQYRDGNNIRPLMKGKLLVETSYMAPPRTLDELLYMIAQDSITPVIAHPERYIYMHRKKYDELKDRDYLLQFNILSLAEIYGESARSNALYLIENQMYDLVGTDLHSTNKFRNNVATIKLATKHIDKLLELKERNDRW